MACCVTIPRREKRPCRYSTTEPSEIRLFFTLKVGLSGTHFARIEEIKSKATAELRKIPKESLRWRFQQWKA
jgi:hypothetical protein